MILLHQLHMMQNKRFRSKIVSHDKDLYQLIDDDKVYLFDPTKKVIIK